MTTISVTPVNPGVNVTGTWSGTLTQTNTNVAAPPTPATLNLTQSDTGTLTATFVPADYCGLSSSDLSLSGVVNGTKISLSGFDDLLFIRTDIETVVDPSGQQMKGMYGMTTGTSTMLFCGDSGNIALTKHQAESPANVRVPLFGHPSSIPGQ